MLTPSEFPWKILCFNICRFYYSVYIIQYIYIYVFYISIFAVEIFPICKTVSELPFKVTNFWRVTFTPKLESPQLKRDTPSKSEPDVSSWDKGAINWQSSLLSTGTIHSHEGPLHEKRPRIRVSVLDNGTVDVQRPAGPQGANPAGEGHRWRADGAGGQQVWLGGRKGSGQRPGRQPCPTI